MSALKRPICWLTRHHWLLQNKAEIDSSTLYQRTYIYKCTVCDKINKQEVMHLD